MQKPTNMENLKKLLLLCWCQETCYPDAKKIWNYDNPSLGQCAVTSLIVQKYFGGKIKKCNVDSTSHYYNEIDGCIIDFTKEQFNVAQINYTNPKDKSISDILANEDTKNRYELLLSKLENILEKGERL